MPLPYAAKNHKYLKKRRKLKCHAGSVLTKIIVGVLGFATSVTHKKKMKNVEEKKRKKMKNVEEKKRKKMKNAEEKKKTKQPPAEAGGF